MTSAAPSARFSVDVPPEMQEGMTAGGRIAPRIGREESLQVPAVLRSRNLIAGTLSTQPIRFHDREGRIAEPTTLLEQIDPDIPNAVTLALTYEDLLFEGISWWRVTRFGWHGYPVQAAHVPIGSVHVSGHPWPSWERISPDVPFPADGRVFIDGVPVPDDEVIRFDSPNPPLLHHAARAIRTCLRLDRTASMYAEEPLPLGYFSDPEGQEPLDDEQIQEVLDDWETARRQRAWGYVGNLKANTLQFNAEQIQLADQRQHAVLEIARSAGVDPEDLGVSTTSRTYQNAESRRLALLDFTLAPFVRAVEQRLSFRDVLPRGYSARVDFNGFLRADTLTRMQTYQTGLQVGAYTVEEIRELEGRPPLSPQQRPAARQPAQPGEPDGESAPDGAEAGWKPTEGPNMPPDDMVKFDDDESVVRLTFDDADVDQTFKVDTKQRTITGLAVPWGAVARSGFSKWRFASDSLRWSDTKNVKLNLHHDAERLVGRATRLQSGNKGLQATFQLGSSPEADRALADAKEDILDGMSIEVDFSEDFGDEWQRDPSDESVRLVRQASLRGVALTGMPAFDDARVASVAASRDHGKETSMGKETPEAPGQTQQFDFDGYMSRLAEKVTESHKTLTEELTQSLGESITAGFKTALENLPSPQEGPQKVRAARFHVTREEPVYTFNGLGHSLVRDAWYHKHDDAAQERLRRYRAQTEEMGTLAAQHAGVRFSNLQFQSADTSSASEIIPPGYRPDLYVPELMQGRPLVGLASRGTIANATPFTVPQFGSSSGASGDHTEGTNPSDGSVSFTTATVSPGAISGRLTLTREIVDSSNPAIDQIALQTMRESYDQQTEQQLYTTLNGTATNTVEYAEASVVTDVRGLLADYPFTRFAAPSGAAINQKATKAFATATDSDGRPLLPTVGASNSVGVGNAVNQGWFIDGLTFMPAWSIVEAAGNDVVLIINRSDVWVWESPLLTFRFEEKQGPANIELNIFGYFGTHVLRPAGVFAVRNPSAA